MAQASAAELVGTFGPGQVYSKLQPVLTELLAQRDEDIKGSRMEILSTGVKAIVLKVTGEGWSYVIKAFNPANPDAMTLLTREFKILSALNAWPLTPRLVVTEDAHLLLITEAIEGTTLDKIVTEDNVTEIARHTGAWYSIFTNSLPRISKEGDWANYLARYDDLFTPDELERNQAMLSALKINNTGMSRNDAVLSNFMRSSEGNLIGLDFAAAAMKPVGWDLLLAGRILAQAFPGKIKAIAQSLVRGWRDRIDGNLPDDFAQLIVFFAEITAHRAPTFLNGPIQKYRENYATAAKSDPSLPEAAHVFRFYGFDNNLEPVPEAAKAELRAALLVQAEEALATPLGEGEVAIERELHEPSSILAKACEMCVGGCCRRGQGSHAYLKAPTLRRLAKRMPNATAAQLVDHYVSQVPETHVADSCLFHSETGCALPREDRSHICNRYVCRFGRIIEASEPKMEADPGPVLLVATDDGRVKRARILDGDKEIEVSPALLDTLPKG